MTAVPIPPMVGIIGVGAIGLAITERLVARGLTVCGYRRSNMDRFRAARGIPMASPEEVATAESLILLLPDDAALDEVMQRIAPGLRERQVVLCLGTHRLLAKRAAAALTARTGAALLDGEISGTPEMLRAGQASVLIAGNEDATERALPLLGMLAKTTTKLGDFGNATRMKLITNFLVGVHTAAAAEALLLGSCLGLEPRMIVDAIASSAGGSVMMAVRGRMMAEGPVKGSGMAGLLRFFDLLREALPALTQEQAPLLGLIEGLYGSAVQDGFGERDIAAIHEALASRFRVSGAEAAR